MKEEFSYSLEELSKVIREYCENKFAMEFVTYKVSGQLIIHFKEGIIAKIKKNNISIVVME